jgi:molybdate transport system substrate-binding protein
LAVVVLALAAGACSGSGASSAPNPASTPGPTVTASTAASPAASGGELTIYAAASLKAALDEVKATYEATNPGTTLTISTDASSALETQIEQGAPVDVFLSADTRNPQALVDKGLTDGDPVDFAGNQLTIVVPSGNPAGITSAADLANPGVKVIAAGDAVPITGYAIQLVANLAMEAGYPTNFVSAYTANIVSKEDNATAVIAKIELGEGDAGIVYATDARASGKVMTIDLPGAVNVSATYAGVVVRGSKHAAAASSFLHWLAGPDGQAILGGFGFRPPS